MRLQDDAFVHQRLSIWLTWLFRTSTLVIVKLPPFMVIPLQSDFWQLPPP
jgi:hypothetical protein